MDLCKYCGVELPKSKRPRVTFACPSHKHRHYRDLNPEKYKECGRRWWSQNLERHRANALIWRKNNPDKVHARHARSNRKIGGRYKHGVYKAKRCNQSWELTKEQYVKIIDSPCVYCGGKLNETGSGLDRKDSDLGYTVENVVPCCGPCNRIKGANLTYQEMKVGMAEIVEFRKYAHLGVIY